MTNFTAGHETRTRRLQRRLDYPDGHIEADPRLAWFLGPLAVQFPTDTHWVHLTRDPGDVAASLSARWEEAIRQRRRNLLRPKAVLSRTRRWWHDPHSAGGPWAITGFAYSTLMRPSPLAPRQREKACREFVEVVNANIVEFLRGRPNTHSVRVEEFRADYLYFWESIGAQGDRAGALAELGQRHNAFRAAGPAG